MHYDTFDPDNLNDEQKAFTERYGLKTNDQLRFGSIQWVLQNPDAHTVCVSLNDFDNIDRVVALSGTELTSADEEKCVRDCLRNGVPAALDTDDGLVVLGKGTKGPKSTILTHAFKQIEVKGKLYEKNGLKYLDIESIKDAVEEGG